jgi:hypothetical protein
VTPIMQKFDDLKCAIARYNRVTALSESPKIAFAYGIITFVNDAIKALEDYQNDLNRCECHDALAVNFKELSDIDYWLKDDPLRQEMHDYADKPLSSYGMTLGLNGVTFTDTLHIYRVIEEGIGQMIARLKQVETTLNTAPTELYLNFYRHLRAQYCEDQAVKDFSEWMMHSGKMSLCKLKSLQAQAIADYVNSGILTCCVEPSEEERSQVDIEAFKKQLPNSYPYEEWFDDSFTVFSRTIRWQGDILVPDYACAGLFIFQHWSQLTETDIHAIFHLDKTLELIHSEMASRNHDDVPEQPDDTDIPELPDELNTPQAKELLEKARNAGYLDDRYQPKLSLTKSSILASVISFELELKDRWKPFEILWNRKNMRSNHSTAISQRNYNEFESEVIEALGLLRK